MIEDLLTISDAEFREAAALVYERFGIHLTEQKKTLVAGRLAKRVRLLGLPSFGAYLSFVKADTSGDELSEFINRISTNHSYFFRERGHFDFLNAKILPSLKLKLSGDPRYPVRFWSAGCAAGEEPYTLAMLIRESLGPRADSADWGVLATDVSLRALGEARRGAYSTARLHELPAPLRASGFDRTGEDEWTVREEIRRSILFKRLNLMNAEYPFKGRFDVVFCRNVMIYFDPPTRRALVDRIYRYVKPGGWFFVGHSESLPRDTCPFQYVQPAVYHKLEDAQ